MKRLAFVALFFVGCQAPVWNGVRHGMTIADVEAKLHGQEVLRPAAVTENDDPTLVVELTDGSHATIAFRPGGGWKYIAVRSPDLSLADARAVRTGIEARLGAPKYKTINRRAEWPDGVLFLAREKRDGVLGTLEARVGEKGAVPLGPKGLSWGMTPREVRFALEGTDELDESDGDAEGLEFGGDHDWLDATFEQHRLARVAYWHIPSLDAAAAEARIRALENELGPANLVEESDDWDWPAQKLTVQILHVRGQATAFVHQVYFD